VTSGQNLPEELPWLYLRSYAPEYYLMTSQKYLPARHFQGLKLAAVNRNCPGAINHIAQSAGMVAVASSVIDGADDEISVSPDHKDGSLVIWYRGHGKIHFILHNGMAYLILP